MPFRIMHIMLDSVRGALGWYLDLLRFLLGRLLHGNKPPKDKGSLDACISI